MAGGTRGGVGPPCRGTVLALVIACVHVCAASATTRGGGARAGGRQHLGSGGGGRQRAVAAGAVGSRRKGGSSRCDTVLNPHACRDDGDDDNNVPVLLAHAPAARFEAVDDGALLPPVATRDAVVGSVTAAAAGAAATGSREGQGVQGASSGTAAVGTEADARSEADLDAALAALSHNVQALQGLDLRHTPTLDDGAGAVPEPPAAAAAAASAPADTAAAVVAPEPPAVGASMRILHRAFAWTEGERVAARREPCAAADAKRALTALILAVVFPPAAHYYYGYVVLGSVQLVAYLALLAPLLFACGWYWNPMPKGLRSFPFENTLGETMAHIDRQRRWLTGILCGAVFLFMGLLAWQVALVVRIATGDFAPASGCPAIPI